MKIVIVTGVAGGIGKASALLLAQNGYYIPFGGYFIMRGSETAV